MAALQLGKLIRALCSFLLNPLLPQLILLNILLLSTDTVGSDFGEYRTKNKHD